MDTKRQAWAAIASRAVVALVVVLVATVALIAVLAIKPAASNSNTTTNSVTVVTPSVTAATSSETQSTSCMNQSSTSSSSTPSQGNVANPVGLNVYFDGSIFQGPMMGFDVNPGSHSAINVTATYPWAGFASMPHDTCIPVSFSIGPFPANSNGNTIPSWLHVSLSSPSAAMVYGSSSSVNLLVSADSSAPQGAVGSFELQVTYRDPASGESATDVNVLNLLASASTPAITRLTEACCSVNFTSLTLAAPAAPGGSANVTLTISNLGYYPAGYFEAFISNGTAQPSNNPPPNSGILFYNGTIPGNEAKTGVVLCIQLNNHRRARPPVHSPNGGLLSGQRWWRAFSIHELSDDGHCGCLVWESRTHM